MKTKFVSKRIIPLIASSCFYLSAMAQSTQTGLGPTGHTSLGPAPTYYLGWDVNSPIPLQIRHDANNFIDFYTNGIQRARVTTGNLLTSTGGVTSGTPGDGIRIMPKMLGCGIPSSSFASLDLWTACNNGTNIRWGLSGEISGANGYFHN